MKRKEKPEFVKKLVKDLESAKSVVMFDYAGLSVKMQQDLKKRLKSTGGRMLVAKNTLFKIAGEKAKLPTESLSDTVLAGPTAYIFAKDDPIAPLQTLYRFAKEHDLLSLKVGIVEGVFHDKIKLEKLATLPSKTTLLSQLVGTIQAPAYGLVGVLNANMQKLVYVLSQKAKN